VADAQRTRAELQRVAAHVLARRRHAATGRFGLRATPGGFGTPAFGSDGALEVLRTDGAVLVHEVGGEVRSWPMPGASLRELASAVGADLATELSVGHDTPPIGDPEAPLEIDPAEAERLGAWLDLGWQALDRVLAGAGWPATGQLWPEHVDAGTTVAVGPGPDDRANLGASLGDGFHPEPYLYVGPWGPERPGDPAYWTAPFGAVLGIDEVPDVATAAEFLQRGVDLLRTDR
jgi:hypothetical protein